LINDYCFRRFFGHGWRGDWPPEKGVAMAWMSVSGATEYSTAVEKQRQWSERQARRCGDCQSDWESVEADHVAFFPSFFFLPLFPPIFLRCWAPGLAGSN
jgi:hypothetical protein